MLLRPRNLISWVSVEDIKQDLAQNKEKMLERGETIHRLQEEISHLQQQLEEKNKLLQQAIVKHSTKLTHVRQHSPLKKEKEVQGLQEVVDIQQLENLQRQLQFSDDQVRVKNEVISEKQEEILQLRQQLQETQDLEQQLRGHIQEKDAVIAAKEQKSLQLRQRLRQQDRQSQELQQQLRVSEDQARQNNAVVAAQEKKILQLRQQLQQTHNLEQQLRVGDGHIQEKDAEKQKLQQLGQQLSECTNPAKPPEEREGDSEVRERELQTPTTAVSAREKKMALSWKMCKGGPCEMQRGSATVCGNKAYFKPDGSSEVYSYNSDTSEWYTLPECHSRHFTLTVVNGFVTAVGGEQLTTSFIWKHFGYYEYTNKLLSLIEKGDWVEHFPAMPTKRILPVVVYSGKFLVVAGGYGKGDTTLATVEVMDSRSDTPQWSTASSLPHPLSDASATVCGDRVYLVGGEEAQCDWTKSVFTCCLSALMGTKMKSLEWNVTSELPVCQSTCVTLNGKLLVVGGIDVDQKDTNNIYSYNTETNSWKIISHMPIPQSRCLVTVLPGEKLMVVRSTRSSYIAEVDWCKETQI